MKQGIGDKVLGWFIVREDDVATRGDDEIGAAQLDAPNSAPVAPPIVTPGATHDAKAFVEVYRAAGIADEDRERLAKVLGLLAALPPEASAQVQRQIVGASLEAFGVQVARVVQNGTAALAALDGYAAAGERRTTDVLAQAEGRIAKLTAEIAEVTRLIELQRRAQEELVDAIRREKARVESAMNFFGASAGARVTDAPARLVRLK